MNRIVFAAVCALGLSAFAADPQPLTKQPTGAGTTQPTGQAVAGKMDAAGAHMTCGQVMAAKSPMVSKFSEYMTTVADNLEAHAKWVTASSKEKAAKAEADVLKKMAKMHRDMASTSKKISDDMVKNKDMASPAHDPAKMDPAAVELMKKTLADAKEFAALLQKDIEMSEKMMSQMGGAAGTK